MRYALISDIHANLQALQAVLADIDKQQIDRILCLGDIVGYGPNPRECVALIRERTPHVLMGNHDAVIAGYMSADLFNPAAKSAIEWTETQLSPQEVAFLNDLPLEIHGNGLICTHGEFVVPGRFGYIFDAQAALASMATTDKSLLFVGHSHYPLYYSYRAGDPLPQVHTAETIHLEPGSRYLINVGSVGQPRDGRSEACYCIYDSLARTVVYRRIPFDFKTFLAGVRQFKLPETAPMFRAAGAEQPIAEPDFTPEPAAKTLLTQRPVKILKINPSGQTLRIMFSLVIVLLLGLLLTLLMTQRSELETEIPETLSSLQNGFPPTPPAPPSPQPPRPFVVHHADPLPPPVIVPKIETPAPPPPPRLIQPDTEEIAPSVLPELKLDTEPRTQTEAKNPSHPLRGSRLNQIKILRRHPALLGAYDERLAPFHFVATGSGIIRKNKTYDLSPKTESFGLIDETHPAFGWEICADPNIEIRSDSDGLRWRAPLPFVVNTADTQTRNSFPVITFLSAPMRMDWEKANRYEIRIQADLTNTSSESKGWLRPCAELPNGELWFLDERPSRLSNGSQSLSIPRKVIPDTLSESKFRIYIFWCGEGEGILQSVKYSEI